MLQHRLQRLGVAAGEGGGQVGQAGQVVEIGAKLYRGTAGGGGEAQERGPSDRRPPNVRAACLGRCAAPLALHGVDVEKRLEGCKAGGCARPNPDIARQRGLGAGGAQGKAYCWPNVM